MPTISVAPHFPPLDPTSYAWEASNNAPNQWRRRALGVETLWIPRPKDYHEIFLGGSLTLESPARSLAVTTAAKAAWRRLRFEVPELTVSAVYGEDESAYMLYEVPQSDEDVQRWLESTTFFECGKHCVGFEELLEKIRGEKRGHDSEQVFLFLRSVSEDGGELVKTVDFMLNADHQITDGIGIRVILSRFLALLAQVLSVPHAAKEALDWQESVTNLSSPWIDLMNEEQVFSGPEYESVASANEEVLFQKMVNTFRSLRPLNIIMNFIATDEEGFRIQVPLFLQNASLDN